MIRAILFDMGGTLDGDGLHWLDRFVSLYRASGVTLPRETLRAAFDAAEASFAGDEAIAQCGIDEMVTRHVQCQFRHLGMDGADRAVVARAARIAGGFVDSVRAAVAVNRPLLAELTDRGFVLGVVSNGCGNVDRLCREFGYSPFFSVVVDSRRAGISKPDPRIFERAVAQLALPAAETLVVGDSFDRDIVPARLAGLRTAWLQPDADHAAPDPSLVDFRLTSLTSLSACLPALAPA
jgi:putative hydrolase of the HAD superfamily